MSLSPPPYREKDLTSQPWQKWFASITDAFSTLVTTAQLTWANINKSGSNLTDIQTRNHSDLQNIQGGDGIDDFAHLTYTERDQLTTGKTTTLHNHPQPPIGQMMIIQEEIYEDSLPGQVALRADQTYVTPRYVGNSPNLDIALLNLDNSQRSQADSGFVSWTGVGNYYSIATNQLTLLRGGDGYIRGKYITWNAGQTTATFTVGSAHWIYIDVNGTIGMSTSRSFTLYTDNIVLFEAYYDGTNYEVCFENHPVSFDTDSMEWIHENIGTILAPVSGSTTIGANITRITTGTGGAITDRQLKIVGAADINDQGLHSTIPDSAGAAITWFCYYVNAGGIWVEFGHVSEIPMFWNNAGTMTALNTGGSADIGIWTFYASKEDPNTGAIGYYAVANNATYNTEAQAQDAINLGLNSIMSGQLNSALEPAQLGTVVITNNVSGGYISAVNIAKSTAKAATTGGSLASNTASDITTVTTNFIGNLSATDTNVQQALNTLDKVRITGIPGQDGETAEPEYYMLQQSMTAINLAQTRAVASLRL